MIRHNIVNGTTAIPTITYMFILIGYKKRVKSILGKKYVRDTMASEIITKPESIDLFVQKT